MPGLVSGVRDAAVLAVYLGVLFFLAVTAASLLISLGASALVRARDERFARSAQPVAERDGVLCYGALGVGGAKMKIHKAAVARLFTANNLVLDADEIYALGKELER